jgi:hypothetical protein
MTLAGYAPAVISVPPLANWCCGSMPTAASPVRILPEVSLILAANSLSAKFQSVL